MKVGEIGPFPDHFDFYEEVRRYEVNLIRYALGLTRGHQRQAARILNLRPTTLHAKIKMYGTQVDPREANPEDRRPTA